MKFLRANRGPLIVLAILVGAWLMLRTSATPVASVAELDALVAKGDSVVLEFFTNT